ncbi:MAG TPA: hypothetical protein VK028_09815, partial [Micromonosporaceae bacterium]|nr:hypothetical protein [Micromonosporaceae bacterium]
LGVMLHGGHAIAVAPRELRALLRSAGWQGEDLLLLSQPPGDLWHAAVEHIQSLVDVFGVDVWLPARGAQVWGQPDGRLAADGPEGGWHVVGYGRTERHVDDASLPAALARAPRPTGGYDAPMPTGSVTAAVADPTVLMPRPFGTESAAMGIPAVGVPHVGDHETGDASSYDEASQGVASSPEDLPGHGDGALDAALASAVDGGPEPEAQTEVPDRPAFGVGSPHRIAWLPDEPAVNRHEIDLYVWTPTAMADLDTYDLPSADRFLLAGQDPLRLADRRPDGYLLRVQAPEGAAIDLRDHASELPAGVRQALSETGATHLLPLAWFRDLRVTARYDLDSAGGIRARRDITPGELAIRFEGADHGVPGLPEDVVRWPEKGQRADAPCYLMLPESTALDRNIVHRGYVALVRRKPALADGHVLMEVKVRKRRAIDVPATLNPLAGLPITGRMHDLVGLDLLLAEQDLGNAILTRYWQQGKNGKPVVTKLTGETLLAALTGEAG